MQIYRGMDRSTLDAAYDNSAAVAGSARIPADWDGRSAALAQSRPEHLAAPHDDIAQCHREPPGVAHAALV
jgi:hypothetical protein